MTPDEQAAYALAMADVSNYAETWAVKVKDRSKMETADLDAAAILALMGLAERARNGEIQRVCEEGRDILERDDG